MHGPTTCHQNDPRLVTTRPTYHLAIVTHPPLTTICSCLGEVPASEFASHTLNEQILLSDAHIPAAKGRLNVCDVRTRWEHRKLRLGDDSQYVNEAATSCWLSFGRLRGLESSRHFRLALGSR